MNRKKRNDYNYKLVVTRPGGIKESIFSMFRQDRRKQDWESHKRYKEWVGDMAEQIRKEVDDGIIRAIVKYGPSATIENVFE